MLLAKSDKSQGDSGDRVPRITPAGKAVIVWIDSYWNPSLSQPRGFSPQTVVRQTISDCRTPARRIRHPATPPRGPPCGRLNAVKPNAARAAPGRMRPPPSGGGVPYRIKISFALFFCWNVNNIGLDECTHRDHLHA
jgi:hypothetical protein